jgi:hypothetical protein
MSDLLDAVSAPSAGRFTRLATLTVQWRMRARPTGVTLTGLLLKGDQLD